MRCLGAYLSPLVTSLIRENKGGTPLRYAYRGFMFLAVIGTCAPPRFFRPRVPLAEGWRRMRCYDTWERLAVRLCGVRWGGAVGLAVLWPTRRAAPWNGSLVRAGGPSAAWDVDWRPRCTVAVWAFLYELTASPLAAP